MRYVVLIVVLLQGCTAFMKGHLFYQGEASSISHIQAPASGTFHVLVPPGASVTEQRILRAVASELSKRGYVEKSGADESDVLAAVRFSRNVGGSTTSSFSLPSDPDERGRVIEVVVADGRPGPANGEVYWQSEITLAGPSSEIASAVESLMPQAFKDFGRTQSERQLVGIVK